jgi:hypothetical protein
MSNSPTFRCYILPILAAIVFIILLLPPVEKLFAGWIPNYYLNIFARSLILLIILYITCRIIAIWFKNFDCSECV